MQDHQEQREDATDVRDGNRGPDRVRGSCEAGGCNRGPGIARGSCEASGCNRGPDRVRGSCDVFDGNRGEGGVVLRPQQCPRLSGRERWERLHDLTESLPQQRTAEWHAIRSKCGNSSQYATMFNVGDRRRSELILTSKHYIQQPSFYMSWGTMMEEMSGHIFSLVTGLSYEEIGSLPHRDYPHIRGSLDGYGLDEKEELFVLETKTPAVRIPSSRLNEMTYLYQVLQNIEIIDADYGLFNDVRLLPCTTEDVTDKYCARHPLHGSTLYCTHSKYNETRVISCDPSTLQRDRPCEGETSSIVNPSHPRPDIRLVAALVHCGTPPIAGSHSETSMDMGGKWLGNVFDSYSESNPSLSALQLTDMIVNGQVTCKPFPSEFTDWTSATGEAALSWGESVRETASSLHTPYSTPSTKGGDVQSSIAAEDFARTPNSVRASMEGTGYAIFKLDVHNVQRIERDTKFWERVLRPVADRWVSDLQLLSKGKEPEPMPVMPVHHLPRP